MAERCAGDKVAEIISMLLDMKYKNYDIWNFRDYISFSQKRDIEDKPDLLFCQYQQMHCVQVFKTTFHEITTIFLQFSEVLAVYYHWNQNHRDFN